MIILAALGIAAWIAVACVIAVYIYRGERLVPELDSALDMSATMICALLGGFAWPIFFLAIAAAYLLTPFGWLIKRLDRAITK